MVEITQENLMHGRWNMVARILGGSGIGFIIGALLTSFEPTAAALAEKFFTFGLLVSVAGFVIRIINHYL